MKVVILVPRRKDDGWRDRVWELCKARWQVQFPEYEILEGHHDEGLFNRSAAINRAAAAGEWDVAVIIDADIFIERSYVEKAVAIAAETNKVVWPHTRWLGISEEATRRLVAPDPDWEELVFGVDGFVFGNCQNLDPIVEKTNPISWSCCFVITRDAWTQLGGFDERFEGWGFEDMAFQSAAVSLIGHERLDGAVYHLWHPRGSGNGAATRKNGGLTREAVKNARLGRRYMVAARRDHGVHDRHAPSDEQHLARDVDNLKRDDAQLAADAARLGLPNWDDWWPTLPELLAGSSKPDHSVTAIVHTDGRREFIAQSIPSLVERVHGNIVRKVIFDDSGDPAYKDWLATQFGAFGFYVVGPTQRLGYTDSMRAMWSYLDRRTPSQYVLLAEDDFLYDRDVDLEPMIDTLERHPYLKQMALLRGPYYPAEIEAGGIIEQNRKAYELVFGSEGRWIEHREYFTANPSVFSRCIVRTPWPKARSSERAYTNVLNRDPASRFAYWGDGEPWVTHIGAYRAGGNY